VDLTVNGIAEVPATELVSAKGGNVTVWLAFETVAPATVELIAHPKLPTLTA